VVVATGVGPLSNGKDGNGNGGQSWGQAPPTYAQHVAATEAPSTYAQPVAATKAPPTYAEHAAATRRVRSRERERARERGAERRERGEMVSMHSKYLEPRAL
jgi:hypothetical protein